MHAIMLPEPISFDIFNQLIKQFAPNNLDFHNIKVNLSENNVHQIFNHCDSNCHAQAMWI